MLENFIMCPKCEDTLVKINEQSYSCNSCKVEFPNYNGIIDLRNLSSDNTKGFSLEKDFAIGQILLKNFAKFENYNGLKFMYEKIAEYFEEASYDYKPISNHEISKILHKNKFMDKVLRFLYKAMSLLYLLLLVCFIVLVNLSSSANS